MGDQKLAAVFIDFENIYYHLRDSGLVRSDVTDAVVHILRSLKQALLDEHEENVLSMDAYADFDRIEENALSQLYLLGVETHNVLGTDHKNAADMRLCIDAIDTFYTRGEIGTFVLVAGDRDYIPVIQHLKKRGRTVRVVGFPATVSGDLRTIVGEGSFVNAARFLSVEMPVAPVPAAPPQTSAWDDDEAAYLDRAMELLHAHFANKPEVWLTPYLSKLRSELPELTEPQRKELIATLQEKGAFRVEKRPGVPHDFSVLVMNWNSELVRRACPNG